MITAHGCLYWVHCPPLWVPSSSWCAFLPASGFLVKAVLLVACLDDDDDNNGGGAVVWWAGK